jgi:GNAT superfamily N-acetyltransferase
MPGLGRLLIEDDQWSLIRLETEDEFCRKEIVTFDCGRDDLTDFFRKDALTHHKQLLATTYYFQPKRATEEHLFVPVALISFLNDSIVAKKDERKTEKKTFSRLLKKQVPFPKRNYEFFPAVKIGRLGVVKDYQRAHIGTSVLNMTKNFFVTQNKTGCRFITVDAYSDEKTINFYKKNGFNFLQDQDPGGETRIMFYDLISHI